jgi:hypothetical protein
MALANVERKGQTRHREWQFGVPRIISYLRCRMRDRMRRFLRPSLRRPLPVFLTPCAVELGPAARKTYHKGLEWDKCGVDCGLRIACTANDGQPKLK